MRVSGHDRERLERLCRYIARPAIATERLTQSEDGRVSYLLHKRWRDGTTGFVFEPEELIEKLVALIPAPRGHLVRYHGVLAARSRWRAEVVRDRRVEAGPDAEVRRTPVPSEGDAEGDAGAWEPAEEIRELRERRLTWSELMLRVFAEDVLKCTRCGGRRKLIAVITQADVIVAFLASLGLPTRAPPMAPVRPADPGEEAHP